MTDRSECAEELKDVGFFIERKGVIMTTTPAVPPVNPAEAEASPEQEAAPAPVAAPDPTPPAPPAVEAVPPAQ
jgi:hypothetical protein